METISRLFKPPEKGSFFLFGPRGTGKSTFVQRHYHSAINLDLLNPENLRLYSARPERLKELIEGNSRKKVIVIDEIQKIPELLSIVHSLIESKKGYTFILTGSSARKLKRSGVNLLAGRALLRTMHPFMASELKNRFNLARALNHGMVPIVIASDSPSDVLQSYAALYLREEVQMEGLVRNIGGFSRFLEAISFSHAAILNISNVAQECAVERKTVEGFVEILEDILLGWRLPVFTRRSKRKLSSHPKFYFFDAGVFRSLRPSGPLDRPQEIDGQALEGLVGQHLKAWIAYSGEKRELFFWRTRSGVEVDFIVYGTDGIFALEVKNTGSIRPQDLRNLKSFHDEYPGSRLFLLYRGKERFLRDNVLCIPCEEFLAGLIPDRPLTDI
jgi:predicted AAA+ superfamily ATPase